MKCETCGSEYTVYDLFPRSYRLYVYLCAKCMKGFLAHHFDLNLEIYNLSQVSAKRFNGILFITGLKFDPRVFEFKVAGDENKEAVVIADAKAALGEFVENGSSNIMIAPYSQKTEMRLNDLLDKEGIKGKSITERVAEAWRRAK